MFLRIPYERFLNVISSITAWDIILGIDSGITLEIAHGIFIQIRSGHFFEHSAVPVEIF